MLFISFISIHIIHIYVDADVTVSAYVTTTVGACFAALQQI